MLLMIRDLVSATDRRIGGGGTDGSCAATAASAEDVSGSPYAGSSALSIVQR